MAKQDSYKLLDLPKSDGSRIKKEYRRLAMTLHPTASGGPAAEHKFRMQGGLRGSSRTPRSVRFRSVRPSRARGRSRRGLQRRRRLRRHLRGNVRRHDSRRPARDDARYSRADCAMSWNSTSNRRCSAPQPRPDSVARRVQGPEREQVRQGLQPKTAIPETARGTARAAVHFTIQQPVRLQGPRKDYRQ